MPYLIDGHNLIPKLSGMDLRQMDDEQRLVDVLSAFRRARPTPIEVFFDQAAPGSAGKRQQGGITIHFVFRTSSADQAIARRLASLGKAARNWTVVTSDRRVQEEARSHQAGVISSEDFARQLQQVLRSAGSSTASEVREVDPAEMEEWLKLFGEHNPGE